MKKRNIKNLETRAEDSFQACLKRIPFLKILWIEREGLVGKLRADLTAMVDLPDGKQELVVVVKNNGQPRFAREVVNQLLRYRTINSEIYGIFMAPYISPKAAEICSKEGMGYIDLAGNCRLSLKQVYIEQVGKPNPFSEKRVLRSLYAPKSSRVLRVLLNEPKKVWRIKELSEAAEVSIGQVSNVKKLLENREWMTRTPEGFVLVEPEKLLMEWHENYSYRKNEVLMFYTIKDIPEIEANLAESCTRRKIRYALTGFSGAVRLAPSVRYQRVTAFVEENIGNLIASMDLKPVSSGANVFLLIPYDEGVFYGIQEEGGVKIASPVQIYLDLLGFRGRGEEAAKMLLEKVIKKQW